MDDSARREANREASRRYYEANRERERERVRLYRAANREAVRERSRLYYAANAEAERERARRNREADPEAALEISRRSRTANREAIREAARRRYAANAEAERERKRLYYEANAEAERERARRNREAARTTVLIHYSLTTPPSCACCGTTESLTIDHVNGGGATHREELFGRKGSAGWQFYAWLIANNFPPGYQVLCRRCNRSKGIGTRCQLDHLRGPAKVPRPGTL
jgi:hypothetical protein